MTLMSVFLSFMPPDDFLARTPLEQGCWKKKWELLSHYTAQCFRIFPILSSCRIWLTQQDASEYLYVGELSLSFLLSFFNLFYIPKKSKQELQSLCFSKNLTLEKKFYLHSATMKYIQILIFLLPIETQKDEYKINLLCKE